MTFFHPSQLASRSYSSPPSGHHVPPRPAPPRQDNTPYEVGQGCGGAKAEAHSTRTLCGPWDEQSSTYLHPYSGHTMMNSSGRQFPLSPFHNSESYIYPAQPRTIQSHQEDYVLPNSSPNPPLTPSPPVRTHVQSMQYYPAMNSSPGTTGHQYPSERVATPSVTEAARRRRKREARFTCTLCGQTFTARHNLENHMNSHNGIRRFECVPCGKAFGTAQVLKRHQSRCTRIST